jgi:hypothetical protein
MESAVVAQPLLLDDVEGDDEYDDDEEDARSDVEEDMEDEDEPRLKYQRMAGSMPSLLSNDAASCITVADRMIALGTHDGTLHIVDYQGNQVYSHHHHHHHCHCHCHFHHHHCHYHRRHHHHHCCHCRSPHHQDHPHPHHHDQIMVMILLCVWFLYIRIIRVANMPVYKAQISMHPLYCESVQLRDLF